MKFTYIEICVIMYNDEHNDDYNVVLMWFLDIDDVVHSSRDEEHDGDQTGMSCICGDTVKLFLMCISYRMYMTYEVNCDMYWQSLVYDFLMLHLCFIYQSSVLVTYIYIWFCSFHLYVLHARIQYITCSYASCVL